ncbi:MAG: hypothetical protein PHO41_06460, partial [Eubacteriales bacterium]|nr:hypothetical protein [Eubacteriales bacterium]
IGVGSITPPMAMCLFACSKSTGVPVVSMVRPIMPYLFFGAVPMLILVSFVPMLSEWLPGLLYAI